jgi:purine-binding chemotaxis protein CheW
VQDRNGTRDEILNGKTRAEEMPMAGSRQLVVFTIDDQQFALNLSCVERIVRAVEITHVPDAPDTVLGVINVEGRIIPVLNSRRRLGFPEREIELSDHFIIVNEAQRSFALVADEVKPVLELSEQQVVTSEEVLPGAGRAQSIAKVEDGMVVVLTVGSILSLQDHGGVHASIGQIEG